MTDDARECRFVPPPRTSDIVTSVDRCWIAPDALDIFGNACLDGTLTRLVNFRIVTDWSAEAGLAYGPAALSNDWQS